MTDRIAQIRAQLAAWEEKPWAGYPSEEQAPHDIAYLLGRLQEAEAEAGVLRGLIQSARGETRSLGDFTDMPGEGGPRG